jgi:serine protease
MYYLRKLSFAALLFASCSSGSHAQESLKPRAAPQKPSLEQMQAYQSLNRVIVKFREGTRIRLVDGQLSGVPDLARFQEALDEYGIPLSAMRKMFTRPEGDLDSRREEAHRRSGRQLADLNLYYSINVPKDQSAAVIANRLNALDIVELAEPERRPVRPVDIPPNTPDYSALQTYKGATPTGINLPTPVQIPGSDGAGFQVVDVENNWQRDHEDSPTTRIVGCRPTITSMAATNHGIAVVGIIAAPSNGYGVTGIAPAATVGLAAIDSIPPDPRPPYAECLNSIAIAINAATAVTSPGDVIVIEESIGACGACLSDQTGCGPVEAQQANYDVIAEATAAGRIVVEAAGNGYLNLDAPACNRIFDRSTRDSGAIIVGAGSSTNRSRMSFSNYGSRVDVHGWGENIATTGYADPFMLNDPRQFYTGGFGGTSGATAIVAGAVLSVQGALKACGLGHLTAGEMRDLLVSTGTPQWDPGNGNVGPLPNVLAALNATNITLCRPSLVVSSESDLSFSGRQGGPFGGAQRTIKSTTGSLKYAISTPPWLSVRKVQSGRPKVRPKVRGIVNQGGVTLFYVPNAYAQSLQPGTYGPDFVTFSNQTNGLGNFTHTATLDVRPRNDLFGSGNFVSLNGIALGTNVNATTQTGEPNHAGNKGGRSVWWAYDAQVSGSVTITTAGTAFDTLLAVYTGTAVDALNLVEQNDDFQGPQSRVTLQAVAGTTYWIAVDGYNKGLGADEGTINLSVHPAGPP